jgi:RNase H-fold protein (predicted Holliday junction resolvase)
VRVSAIAAALVTLSVAAADQQPQFRASVSVVRLEVSVTDERGPMRGLQPDDFVVHDSGMRQVVRVEEVADAPLDLMLVAQPMSSVAYTSGRWIRDQSYEVDTDQISRVTAGLSAFLGQVHERDRLGVVLAGAPPTRLRPLEFGRPSFDVTAFAGGNYAAPFDGITAALREFGESDRRRALVAFTNAADFRSVVRFDALAEMARRLGPQFVLVGTPITVDEATDASAQTSAGRQIGETVRGSVSGSIVPWPLQLLARRTGGITVNVGAGDPRQLIDAMFKWLRTQYVVSYEQPPGKGWHPVNVTVSRRGAKITVREGYFVD